MIPFSNGAEWDAWSEGWCNRCAHEETCPLLDLVFICEETPREWFSGNVGARGPERYICTAYQASSVRPVHSVDDTTPHSSQ